MMSVILSVCLVVYIILLIISCKSTDNGNIKKVTLLLQGVLWTLVAIDSWQNSHMIMRIVYVAIVALSFFAAIQRMVKK